MSGKEFGYWVLGFVGMFVSLWVGLYWPNVAVYAWNPPSAPKEVGVLANNYDLVKADLLGDDTVIEPEDVMQAPGGGLLTSCKDGKIRYISPKGKVSVWADTKGRPLGMAWAPSGHLIVADHSRGLLSVNRQKKVEVVANKFKGKLMKYVDDVDVSSGGDIYFSDASEHFTYKDTRFDLISRNPTGRLFKVDGKTKKLSLLLGGLYFGNGVALSKDERSVLITETGAYRIRRYWLKGPKAGKDEVFSENLPGFPDNINRAQRGGYWLAIASPRIPRVDQKIHPSTLLKKMLFLLPKSWLPRPLDVGLVLHLDEHGKITRALRDPKGRTLPNVTSVNEHNGYLYLGHIYQGLSKAGRLKVP